MSAKPKFKGEYQAGDDDLFRLFDTGEMEHVHDLIASGERIQDGLLRLVVKPLRQLISRIFESGRGTSAPEYPAATSFLSCAETTASCLALSEGRDLEKEEARELADDLRTAWTEFIAHAGAYRMYHALPIELVKAEKKSMDGKMAVEKRYANNRNAGISTVAEKVKAEWGKLADRPEHERGSLISQRTGIHVVTVRNSIKAQGLRKTKS